MNTKMLFKGFLALCCLTLLPIQADASTKLAMDAVQQDSVMPFPQAENRQCVDGTQADGRAIIDYWVDLECPYCKVDPVIMAQMSMQDKICIVIRHKPRAGGDSFKKSLAYEALHKKSSNAANSFWSSVSPKGAVSAPYNKAVMDSLESILLPIDMFNFLIDEATPRLNEDINASQGKILYTPTFVIEGFRFPACDFSAKQLQRVFPIAQSARKGNKDALERIKVIITNGIQGKPML